MTKTRLEAFSDGVIAIIITIMVLELKVPHGSDIEELKPLCPSFFGYVLSFVFVGIYWNNHHHLVHLVHRVTAKILWANLHLLFWLSLIPFTTGWVGEHHNAPWPTACYGVVLLAAGIAYLILQNIILAQPGVPPRVIEAFRNDVKGPLSAAMYALGIGVSFVMTGVSDAIYVAVALTWFIPDRRIEKALADD